jgi:CheY-like chemotaxis protein
LKVIEFFLGNLNYGKKMQLLNTILLVDDDYVTNYLTERQIKNSNFARTVKSVKNGEEALTYLAEPANKTPELILLDINMPEMDGLEFLKYFKEMTLEKDIRIILLTAMINEEKKKKLNLLGYEEIMEKPFSVTKLKEMLKSPSVSS